MILHNEFDAATLHRHIASLATLRENGSLLVSCYLNLERGTASCRAAFDARADLLEKSLPDVQRADLRGAFALIDDWLCTGPWPAARGLAIFARGGVRPFFLALELRTPVPDWISVNSAPNLYHLVAALEEYDRYVVLLANEGSMRILAIHVCGITRRIWQSRPDLRRRVGKAWSIEHFQDHRPEYLRGPASELIRIAGRLMEEGGNVHLVLAGKPRLIAGLRDALPAHLAGRLVERSSTVAGGYVTDVMTAALNFFLKHEETDSPAMLHLLMKQILTQGPAVTGMDAAMQALLSGQADALVLSRSFQPGSAWICDACGCGRPAELGPARCPRCGSAQVRHFDMKDEMIRLAQQTGCAVAIVQPSDELTQLGGAGCLLRHAGRAIQGEMAA